MEIHEKILLYLFEHRDKEEYFDLLIEFKSIPYDILNERIEYLREKDFIDVQYPFTGVGFFNMSTGQVNYPHAEKNDYRKARIRTHGIDYVKNTLIKNDKTESVSIKDSVVNIGNKFHGDVNQSSDSSQNKSISPGTINKKNIVKTISIIIGIIVGLLSIAYYFFEIKKNI